MAIPEGFLSHRSTPQSSISNDGLFPSTKTSDKGLPRHGTPHLTPSASPTSAARPSSEVIHPADLPVPGAGKTRGGGEVPWWVGGDYRDVCTIQYWGFLNFSYPKKRDGLCWGKPKLKWKIYKGTPILGNLHILGLITIWGYTATVYWWIQHPKDL